MKIAMKKIVYLIMIVCVLASCQKNAVTTPNFNITISNDTFKVGDTVTFNFSGNATYVSFFSGEPNHQYQYSQRTLLNGKTFIQFYSYKKDTSSLQPDTLQLLVSKNLVAYNSKAIDSANWFDITNRAKLAIGPDTTYSGMIDVSDLVAPDSTFYFAFRRAQPKSTAKTIHWAITNFNMSIHQSDSSWYSIISMKNAGWSSLNLVGGSVFKWTVSPNSTNPIALISGPTAGINNQATDDWILTKAFQPINVSRDTGMNVEYLTTYIYPTFRYVYKTSGTYTATFLGINANTYDSKQAVRSVKVTIVDR